MKKIKLTKDKLYQALLSNIESFTYRDERYNTPFALAAIYVEENISFELNILKNKLRKTDLIIELCNHTFCVAFDKATDVSYLKAVENLNLVLKEMDYKDNFFISAVDSQDYNHDYLKMSNQLFDRLDYALENRLFNTVIAQDYII